MKTNFKNKLRMGSAEISGKIAIQTYSILVD
jgi:hypothetical protein